MVALTRMVPGSLIKIITVGYRCRTLKAELESLQQKQAAMKAELSQRLYVKTRVHGAAKEETAWRVRKTVMIAPRPARITQRRSV